MQFNQKKLIIIKNSEVHISCIKYTYINFLRSIQTHLCGRTTIQTRGANKQQYAHTQKMMFTNHFKSTNIHVT